MNEKIVKVDGTEIELSNLDKKLYPKDGYTKQDIINYYEKISPYMLTHLADRPLVMDHYPDGINGEHFYQKQTPGHFPKWIKRIQVKLEKGGSDQMVVAEKKADLVYLANQAVITPHVFLSRAPKLHCPDKIVFDLDPSKKDLSNLRFAALEVKKYFEKLGHSVFVMTSGVKGYHVVIPIKPTRNFDLVREAAKGIAAELARKFPDVLTDEVVKNKRRGRVFLDYLRNSYGQISVAPYSLRAVDSAPVATPITWSELPKVAPQNINIKNILSRVVNKKDPWARIYQRAKELKV